MSTGVSEDILAAVSSEQLQMLRQTSLSIFGHNLYTTADESKITSSIFLCTTGKFGYNEKKNAT